MARPKKQNADYFSHDNNMRNTKKTKALRKRFGHVGYSIWNMLLEALTEADEFKIELTPLNVELFSGDFDITTKEFYEIIDYCIKIELIQVQPPGCNGQIIYCEELIDRFSGLLSKRNRDRNYYKTDNPPPKTTNKKKPAAEKPQSKVKESKVKESNKKNIKKSLKVKPLGIHLFKNSPYFDIENFKKEFEGTKYDAFNLEYYYELVKNWSEAGGKMKKDWIATARNFMLSDLGNNKARYNNTNNNKPKKPIIETAKNAINEIQQSGN